MATISIADNDARVQYSQAVTADTTQLTVDFPFFELDNINVIATTNAGVDTVLTRGTGTGTFAVVGTAVDDGFSGGYVTLGDDYANTFTFTIFRDIEVSRTTDFPTSGPFNVNSLNTELDRITAIEQELETKISRTMGLADSDASANLKLPNLDTRKGTVLAFNATSGLPEAGPSIGSVNTVSAQSANINTVAGISANVTTVAGIQANVTTVANIDSSVTTVAGDTANIATVVANLTDIQNAEEHAQEAKDYATKVDGQVQENGSDTGNYASKAWAIGGTGVTDTAGSGAAKEWATETGSNVDGTEYSAKEYSIGTGQSTGMNTGSAKQWALGGGNSFATNTTVDGSNYSARYWAEQAQSYVQQDFENKYLGPHSSDPTQDPYDADPSDSQALEAGDLYFNTTNNILRVYDGTNWNDAVQDTTNFATNGFSIAMAIAL